MDRTMDWAVARFSDETRIADPMMSRGPGLGGRLCGDRVREDMQVSWNRVALQAWAIAGWVRASDGRWFTECGWRRPVAEESAARRERKRRAAIVNWDQLSCRE